MDESKDEVQNPLSEENWMKQSNCKFIKYVNQQRHPMTPKQLKIDGFPHTTENPCVIVRVNFKTKFCECTIIHEDEIYIASSTLHEILHIVKNKYKIKITTNDYQGSNFPYDPGGTLIC